MRTHSITLDDESSHIAKEMKNFSGFVRKALKDQQDGDSIAMADLTNRRRLALALYAVECISNDHGTGTIGDNAVRETAEQCRALLLELMTIA
jgi:hypothetical protein